MLMSVCPQAERGVVECCTFRGAGFLLEFAPGEIFILVLFCAATG